MHKSPDFLFYPYKVDKEKYMKYKPQKHLVYDIPFTQYFDKIYKESKHECKSCPNFKLWINKTIHGECKKKGHLRSYDKMHCHPDFKNNVRFHCYSCGKKGRHTTFLLREINNDYKYYRIWICRSCLKSFFRHLLKSLYRWVRYDKTYPEDAFTLFNELKKKIKEQVIKENLRKI